MLKEKLPKNYSKKICLGYPQFDIKIYIINTIRNLILVGCLIIFASLIYILILIKPTKY